MKNTMWKKTLAVVAATGIATSLLAGCASSGKPADKPAEPAKQSATIKVWSHWGDKELDALKAVAQEWAQKTGNKVEVLNDKSDFQAFATAAQSGKGPDVMFGMPHDNLGTFAKAGLLAELPSDLVKESNYTPVGWQAVTVDGKKLAMPISMETYALFYNTEKIPTPPKTWDEFIAAAQKNGFMFDVNNFYFAYAFIAGNGGYVFKNNNGTYDTNDIGLGNEGAIKGYATLRDFVQKYKFMPADVNGDIAKAKFSSKNVGLYISGPWDVSAMQKAKVPYAVAPLPTLEGGKTAKTFVGVQTAFVSSKSQNQKQAWDLLKYISENGNKKFLEVGARIPVLKSALEDSSFTNNKIAAAFAEAAKSGEPMPNIPAIQAVWAPEGNNLKLLTSGKATPEKVAQDVVAQVKQGIATQK